MKFSKRILNLFYYLSIILVICIIIYNIQYYIDNTENFAVRRGPPQPPQQPKTPKPVQTKNVVKPVAIKPNTPIATKTTSIISTPKIISTPTIKLTTTGTPGAGKNKKINNQASKDAADLSKILAGITDKFAAAAKGKFKK